MLIIEIIMTVAAYRRGFKGWALLPLGLGLLIGVFIGVVNPEYALSNEILDLVWIDIMAIVALGIMIYAGKTEEEKSETAFNESETLSSVSKV